MSFLIYLFISCFTFTSLLIYLLANILLGTWSFLVQPLEESNLESYSSVVTDWCKRR